MLISDCLRQAIHSVLLSIESRVKSAIGVHIAIGMFIITVKCIVIGLIIAIVVAYAIELLRAIVLVFAIGVYIDVWLFSVIELAFAISVFATVMLLICLVQHHSILMSG